MRWQTVGKFLIALLLVAATVLLHYYQQVKVWDFNKSAFSPLSGYDFNHELEGALLLRDQRSGRLFSGSSLSSERAGADDCPT